MDPISMEDLFSTPQDGSPGAQLHLYRLIQLLASRESFGLGAGPLSYMGAKRLSTRLGIDTPQRLELVFANIGLGKLDLNITPDGINAVLTPGNAISVPSLSVMPAPDAGTGAGCTLEHGLIDGALEILTGVPVVSAETRCWTRGEGSCVFEAVRDSTRQGGYLPPAGAQAFIPRGTGVFGHEVGMRYGQPGGFYGYPAPGPTVASFPASQMISHHPAGWPGTGGFHSQATAGHGIHELRAWYLELIGRELAKAKRHGRELSVLYVDLDGLGQLNNSHGRAAGDQIISAVALALSRSCRTEDYMWHHGDDEFAVVLSETGTGKAELVVGPLSPPTRSAAEFVEVSATVSASIGFSTFPNNAESVSDLFSSARAALHLAKSRGRGKTQSAAGIILEGAAGRQSELDAGRGRAGARQERRDREYRQDDLATHVQATDADDREETAAGSKPSDVAASMVIASASPLLLAGMREVLSDHLGIEIIGGIEDPARFSAMIDDIRPDLIFADLEMASANDFSILKTIEAGNLPCKLVVSASEVDQDVIKLAVDFSVDGVILQNSPPREIVEALERVYQGRRVYPEDVQIAIAQLESNRRLLGELSERELEVLRLVAEGKSNSQISEDLFITVNTVRFHLANIYQKLSVSNRTEAANYYLKQDMNSENQTKLL